MPGKAWWWAVECLCEEQELRYKSRMAEMESGFLSANKRGLQIPFCCCCNFKENSTQSLLEGICHRRTQR